MGCLVYGNMMMAFALALHSVLEVVQLQAVLDLDIESSLRRADTCVAARERSRRVMMKRLYSLRGTISSPTGGVGHISSSQSCSVRTGRRRADTVQGCLSQEASLMPQPAAVKV